MAPHITARVRHMDAERPIEIRIHEDGIVSSFAMTAAEAALFKMQFDRVLRQAVEA